MALSANLQDYNNANPITVCRTFPNCVIDYLDGEPAQPETQRVLVTIGIFTITRLERDVQIMIPSYDFVFPARNVRQRPMIRAKFLVKLIFLQTHSSRRTQYTVATVTLLIHLLLNAVVKTDYTEKPGLDFSSRFVMTILKLFHKVILFRFQFLHLLFPKSLTQSYFRLC